MNQKRQILKENTLALGMIFETYVEKVVEKAAEDNRVIWAATAIHICSSLELISDLFEIPLEHKLGIFNALGIKHDDIKEGHQLLLEEVRNALSTDDK